MSWDRGNGTGYSLSIIECCSNPEGGRYLKVLLKWSKSNKGPAVDDSYPSTQNPAVEVVIKKVNPLAPAMFKKNQLMVLRWSFVIMKSAEPLRGTGPYHISCRASP